MDDFYRDLGESYRAVVRAFAGLDCTIVRGHQYDPVAQVMSTAARAGMKRIGFVTDPSH